MTNRLHLNEVVHIETISRLLSNLIPANPILSFRQKTGNVKVFDRIFGYERIKRTFVRTLISEEPVHILLVGLPGHANTLFLKCILETFGEKGVLYSGW
jgi:hypothetical protein